MWHTTTTTTTRTRAITCNLVTTNQHTNTQTLARRCPSAPQQSRPNASHPEPHPMLVQTRAKKPCDRETVCWLVACWGRVRVPARKKLRLQLYDPRVPTFTLAPTCRGNHLPQRCVLCPSLHALAALQPRATCAFHTWLTPLSLLAPCGLRETLVCDLCFGFHATLRLLRSGFATALLPKRPSLPPPVPLMTTNAPRARGSSL